MRVVVVGDLMVDVVAAHDDGLAVGSDTPATIRLQGGGQAGNVAAWLAFAGADVALVGRVGDDELAPAALRGLDGVDLRVTHAAGGRTGTCVVLVDAERERTMLPDAGANLQLSDEDLGGDLFTEGDVLCLSGYTLLRQATRQVALTALDRAREAGMRIVLDAASAAPLRAFPGFAAAAGAIDLLLVNDDEAAVLGDAVDARETVVTHGAAGATWTDGERSVSVPAQPANVVDTTGAGDAFAAGFLTAWPGPPEPALAAGAVLAGRAVARPGARP